MTHHQDDDYVKLRQYLDRLGLGWPQDTEGKDIRVLKQLYTPEDAKIIPQMIDDYRSAAEFARMTGMDPIEAEKKLYEMSKRGVIYRQKIGGVDKYRPVPLFHGTYEFNIHTPKITPEFLTDFFDNLGSEGFSKALQTPTPFFRTIPIKRSLVAEDTVVADYDDLEKILNKHKTFALCTCACRQNRRIRGVEVCDHPLETCLVLGGFAEYAIENNMGREVTREEAFKTMVDGFSDGRCTSVINSKDVECICSCCECGCDVIKIRQALGEKGQHWSNYVANKDVEMCTGCETCIDECPVHAISSADDKVELDEKICIGCGMCANVCPESAIVLVKRAKQYEPAETIFDSYKEMNKYLHDIG